MKSNIHFELSRVYNSDSQSQVPAEQSWIASEKNILLTIKFASKYEDMKPGPASSVGKRPSTNPKIRVWFSVAADEFFFRVRGRLLYATSINSEFSLQCENQATPSTGKKFMLAKAEPVFFH